MTEPRPIIDTLRAIAKTTGDHLTQQHLLALIARIEGGDTIELDPDVLTTLRLYHSSGLMNSQEHAALREENIRLRSEIEDVRRTTNGLKAAIAKLQSYLEPLSQYIKPSGS